MWLWENEEIPEDLMQENVLNVHRVQFLKGEHAANVTKCYIGHLVFIHLEQFLFV